ncbi:MAG: glycosyltransferase [ANME-2 cluster archaeon]|nr:glycosyltransferase [ANME-2 cluster archaeon]MBC2745985.1 glycosyltransferase [ANME-2 cluster archaeon]
MLFNPLNYPSCFSKPDRLTDITSWHEHIPFAFTIVQMLKPKIFVELGTHKGDSYCAFCQVVSTLGLDTACYAVDTWEGDEHAGFYGSEILEELKTYHDSIYKGFSQLIQSRFEEALDHFSDGSIDLIHIDGCHTYDAVKHDYEAWLPKMSQRGVVLLHDINVHEKNFGVWKFWEEISKHYPSFEFKHGYGLGVLAVGVDVPGEVLNFLNMEEQEIVATTKLYSYLGDKIALGHQLQARGAQINELNSAIQARDTQINELNSAIQTRDTQIDELNGAIQARDTQIDELNGAIQARDTQIDELNGAIQARDAQIDELNSAIQARDTQIDELNSVIQARGTQIDELNGAIQARDAQINELNGAIQARGTQIDELNGAIQARDTQIDELNSTLQAMQQSIIWRLLMKFHNGFVERLLPMSTKRRKLYDFGLNRGRTLVNEGPGSFLGKSRHEINDIEPISSEIENDLNFLDFYKNREKGDSVQKHDNTVDIIICVHNAFDDVKKCLESVIKYTAVPYSLLLVDDGSDAQTMSYLEDFAKTYGAKLVRNEIAKGYTFASNQALRLSIADYVVLLNSDTVVTPEWLDRMMECAESDERTGIVGPLSNTASWQSVPEIEVSGDWAQNDLPSEISIEKMGGLIAKYSARLYPEIPFLNGFCLLIKRDLINDIGYFDEELFGKGYGEENDYCIRACKSQWNLRVADDVYIYHAQSRSYSNEKRKELCKRADDALLSKHGKYPISAGVLDCRYDRILEGIRARTKELFIRQELINTGKKRWEGKRILFILPVIDPGGGAYVVIQESMAMLDIGIDVRLLNLKAHKEKFENNYPDLKIPIIYSQSMNIDIDNEKFDAAIATINTSVDWLESITQKGGKPVRGYYIQDFEPYFYQEGSIEFKIAWKSYTKFPDIIRITKTKWNAELVKDEIGVNCQVVGPSVDIDLFRPRPRNKYTPNRPIYIGAMVRPSSPRRGSLQSINLLRNIAVQYKGRVKIIIFGCTRNELNSLNFLNDFAYHHMDVLYRKGLAFLMNELDIFVDFSSYQAMGLTALEAMACGATVIVPQTGGSKEFVTHELNGLVVDTLSENACLKALNRLIVDDELRIKLGKQALRDACRFSPERAAYNTLMVLFNRTN